MLLERLFFIFLFIISALFFIYSFTLPFYSETGVFGSGFYPRWISGILLLVTGYYLIKLMVNKVNEVKEEKDKKVIMNQTILVISLFISFGLIYVIGLLPSAVVFMVFTLVWIQKISWVKSIILTLVTISALFGVFDYWLNIPFPRGMFA